MKLSVIALSGIVLAFSGMVEGESCVEKIDTAQSCLDQCVDIPKEGANTLGSYYGNQLAYCLDPTSPQTESLEACCDMDGSKGIWNYTATSCDGSLTAANDCLTTELATVRTAGVEYLQCIADYYTFGLCQFANFCLNFFAGGYGTGSDFGVDFAVGSTSSLADDFRNAATCEDPGVTKFGNDVCKSGNGCCYWCNDELARVVNAVMDDILLPTYSSISDCGGETTCEAYLNTTDQRDLEMVAPVTTSPENADLAAELGTECTGTLSQEIVLYNETYAISNYFDCLGKKMAKIAAVTDEAKQESSGISLSLGPVTAISMIASAVYFVIA